MFSVPKKGEISIYSGVEVEYILHDLELLNCEKRAFFERCTSCNVAAEEVL